MSKAKLAQLTQLPSTEPTIDELTQQLLNIISHHMHQRIDKNNIGKKDISRELKAKIPSLLHPYIFNKMKIASQQQSPTPFCSGVWRYYLIVGIGKLYIHHIHHIHHIYPIYLRFILLFLFKFHNLQIYLHHHIIVWSIAKSTWTMFNI